MESEEAGGWPYMHQARTHGSANFPLVISSIQGMHWPHCAGDAV
jgi:hypothetical protein